MLDERDEAAANTLLRAVLDLPAAERSAWLDGACAGRPGLRRLVDSLLTGLDGLDGFLEHPATMPARFGPWRVLREIGHGGMGVVYEVERDDDTRVRQRAAVKLMHGAGASAKAQLVERFLRERSILAGLEHRTSRASSTLAPARTAARTWRWSSSPACRSTSTPSRPRWTPGPGCV